MSERNAMSSKLGAGLAVMSAGLLWASAGVIGEASTLPPLVLAEIRLGMGAAALFLVVGLRRTKRVLGGTNWRTMAGAVVGIGLFQWGYFAAVASTGASFATWGTVATGPLWAAAIARMGRSQLPSVQGGRLPMYWAVGLGLALMAIEVRLALTGLLTTLSAGLAYAVYAASANQASIADDIRSRADGSLTLTALALAGGALTLLPLAWPAFSELKDLSLQTADLGRIAFLGLGSTALAYFLFANGVSRLGAEKALSFQWIQPVATDILYACTPDCRLSPIHIAGMVLLTVALLGNSMRASPALRHDPAA
jgi:DME family drug/metabolite transporter